MTETRTPAERLTRWQDAARRFTETESPAARQDLRDAIQDMLNHGETKCLDDH